MIARLLVYLWTFRRCYRWASRQAPRHLRLEATIERLLREARRPRSLDRNGAHIQNDTCVSRQAVASFYRMAALHCFLGRQYADLMGVPPSRTQWETLATIGALAKIQDYIVDRLPSFSQEEQDRIYADPSSYRPTNLAGALFKETFVGLIELLPREQYPEYHRVLDEIYSAQKESRRQRDQDVSLQELRAITMRKGSYGILAGLHVLNPHLRPLDPEYEALLSIGRWGQMVEDILDELEDRREGNDTLMTRMDPTALEGEITALRERSLELIGALSHYPIRQRETCLFRIFIPSVPAIARLRQLAAGRDIVKAWQRRRYVGAGGMALDFLRDCFAQMRGFNTVKYVDRSGVKVASRSCEGCASRSCSNGQSAASGFGLVAHAVFRLGVDRGAVSTLEASECAQRQVCGERADLLLRRSDQRDASRQALGFFSDPQ